VSKPGDRLFQVIHNLSVHVQLHDDPDVFQISLGMLQPVERDLLVGQYCQSEVCNGGFWQLFYNSTGVLAPDARDAFTAIGIPEWAACLDEAMRFFGPRYPRARQTRIAALERKRTDGFRAIDERFYAWSRGEPDRWYRMADAYAARDG
jgi:hypothetical protein